MLLAFLQRPQAWVVPALERLLLVLVLVRKWPGRHRSLVETPTVND